MNILLSWPILGIAFAVGLVSFLVGLLEAADPLGRGRSDVPLFLGLALLALAVLGTIARAVLWLIGVSI